MRYADGELPWFLRIPLRAALVLPPDFGSESVSGGDSRLLSRRNLVGGAEPILAAPAVRPGDEASL